MVLGNWTLTEAVDQTAFFEEEEENQYECEDEETRTQYQFHFMDNHDTKSFEADELIICIGSGNAFIETYTNMGDSQHIASYLQSKSDSDSSHNKSSKKNSCHVYKSLKTLICSLKYHIEPKDLHNWTSTLLQNINVNNIKVLCQSPKYLLRNQRESDHGDGNDIDVLRCLSCHAERSSSLKVKVLENQNIVKDLPAAMFNYCSAYEKSCTLYIAYTESHFVDVFTLKCFEPLLKEVTLSNQVSDSVLATRLKNFEGYGVSNNVYI
ncbi:proteasome assembly chaperone 1-like [Clytia hemisphaerica]|uniref:proteasome assembly chaperone 1-like n=1 Tax=Clytia hemisphaerica TaxID=252671 RepID=UPI0034D5C6A9